MRSVVSRTKAHVTHVERAVRVPRTPPPSASPSFLYRLFYQITIVFSVLFRVCSIAS